VRCGHCPIDGPCRGEPNGRLCELVDPNHPDHNPAYRSILSPDSGEVHPIDPEVSRLNSLMFGCPHRSCSCSVGYCAKLAREVVAIECHRCISEGRNG
jgi:hypothetical protein